MKTMELYIQDVLSHVSVSDEDRARIEADLRAHFEEGVAAGLTEDEAIARMGSPEEVAAEFMSTLTPAFAAHSRRLGAMLVDCCLVFGIGALLVLAMFSTLVVHGEAFAATFESAPAAPMLMFPVIGALFSLLPISYFVFCEWLTGRTVGKWLFGLMVTDEGGQRPGFSRALVRHLSILFAPVFIIDGAVLLVTEKRQRALELVARTSVRNTRSPAPLAVAWIGLFALFVVIATGVLVLAARMFAGT